MAKKQTKNANKSQKAKQVNQAKNQTKKQTSKQTTKQLNEKRTLTKKEILFFRIGVSVIAIGLVVAAIVMIVNNYMNNEDENPYVDYQNFVTEELVAMTKKNADNTYGDLPDYFLGKPEYEDFRVVLNDNEVFYFYFYNSNDIDESIQTEIESLENISDLPLIFIDLSSPDNLNLIEDTNLLHLGLDADASDMLLIYDMQPDAADEFFEVITDVEDIILELGNL
jgi:hypothetical protein